MLLLFLSLDDDGDDVDVDWNDCFSVASILSIDGNNFAIVLPVVPVVPVPVVPVIDEEDFRAPSNAFNHFEF